MSFSSEKPCARKLTVFGLTNEVTHRLPVHGGGTRPTRQRRKWQTGGRPIPVRTRSRFAAWLCSAGLHSPNVASLRRTACYRNHGGITKILDRAHSDVLDVPAVPKFRPIGGVRTSASSSTARPWCTVPSDFLRPWSSIWKRRCLL